MLLSDYMWNKGDNRDWRAWVQIVFHRTHNNFLIKWWGIFKNPNHVDLTFKLIEPNIYLGPCIYKTVVI